MTSEQVLDEILPGLADDFEAGNRNFRGIKPSSADDFEPLRECLAVLIAEGSLLDYQKTATYQFTPAGYVKYKPRIDALRALPRLPQSNTTAQTEVALADPKDIEEQRKRQIVREVLASRFDDSDKSLFQFIYDNGEISVKALAQTQKFGPNLYAVLDRAVRANLLKKQVREGHTIYSINPQLKSALGFVITEGKEPL